MTTIRVELSDDDAVRLLTCIATTILVLRAAIMDVAEQNKQVALLLGLYAERGRPSLDELERDLERIASAIASAAFPRRGPEGET